MPCMKILKAVTDNYYYIYTIMGRLYKYLFVLICIFSNMDAYAQSAGVYPSICGNSGSYNYTYTNTTGGSHSSEYSIYRNGVLIHSDFDGISSGLYCQGLYFVSESTGFILTHDGPSGTSVYKTTNYGDNWTQVAYGFNALAGFYPVNEYCGYMVTYHWVSPTPYWLIKFDLLADTVQTLIDNYTGASDIYLTDTLSGEPLCQGLDSVIFTMQNFGFYINVVMPEATGIDELNTKPGLVIYPNPTENGTFALSQSKGNIKNVSLYSSLGQQVKTFDKAAIENNNYAVDEFAAGLYLVVVHTDKGDFKTRFIKRN